MELKFENSEAGARGLDEQFRDSCFRQEFCLPDSKQPIVYLVGNSLGLQPKKAKEYVVQEIDDWARLGVEGHLHAKTPWYYYQNYFSESTARLVGAQPQEVVVMNTLSVNLHLAMVSFYRPTKERHKVLMEANAFCSDRYAVASQVKFHGYDAETSIIATDELLETIDREGSKIALVLVGGVNYLSGRAFDMQAITDAAHRKGCLVGFDLAHAAGNLVLKLHDWNADFAVWCSYKYLNGGPGAIAGMFVHDRHGRVSLPRFEGWWGTDEKKRFEMGPKIDPIPGVKAWQLSNPPILSAAPLRASMEIFDRTSVEDLRARGERLTAYCEYLFETEGIYSHLEMLTPRQAHARGAQISMRLTKGQSRGKGIVQGLREKDIVCDFREPDVIRFALAPLYNTFQDVYRFARELGESCRKSL